MNIINEFSHKIQNKQRNILPSYTIKMEKNRNQGSNPTHHLPQRIKYIEINQSKETKYPYAGNYKRLMKEIQKTKTINISCSWIRRISNLKITILPKAIYRVNAVVKLLLEFSKN